DRAEDQVARVGQLGRLVLVAGPLPGPVGTMGGALFRGGVAVVLAVAVDPRAVGPAVAGGAARPEGRGVADGDVVGPGELAAAGGAHDELVVAAQPVVAAGAGDADAAVEGRHAEANAPVVQLGHQEGGRGGPAAVSHPALDDEGHQ